MGEQKHELPREEEEEEEQRDFADSGSKRKLEDTIELAKQKAQEIAARLVGDTDPKRPRLASDTIPSSETPAPLSNSYSAPPSYPVSYAAQPSLNVGTSKIISIPNGKVGVVIGKGGETIKYIQLQSGARIQITKDQEADPHALTRDVELTGTSEQISRAEQLINDVIAEADVGSSGSSAAHGSNAKQSGGEQIAIKVPNDKVGLLIGKGGETIKYMQNKSGARMQIIPLHPPPGDTSNERTVYINGSKEQVEAARDLVNDVVSGKRILNPSTSNTYAQPMYAAGGNWAQPGQPPIHQQPQYGYGQPGPPYYSNYAQQPTWDQSNFSTLSQTTQPVTGYGYYGQQPQMGSAPPNPNYSYGQTPVASTGYDQSYGQQPPSYAPNVSTPASTVEQQNPYASSGYGQTTQPDGAIPSQSTQTVPSYPPASYSQSIAHQQAYWTSSSYGSQPPGQTGYDQSGYSEAGYSTQPVYGQGGYPPQPTVNYAQGAYPVSYGEPQSDVETQPQATSNGPSQSVANGTETEEKNLTSSNGSKDATAQEAVPSQS
ncbi:hypothetical protein Tsubulata_017784 [Turnera subulata]|uniref:K Homology domain-containing protein n=1 Tax=Turnera subulata TaxID=218843 RepID=A0A9Q0J6D6_9ROSI|nr:hypothetical protein Tsubulata_017784 [Turnera subulata]